MCGANKLSHLWQWSPSTISVAIWRISLRNLQLQSWFSLFIMLSYLLNSFIHSFWFIHFVLSWWSQTQRDFQEHRSKGCFPTFLVEFISTALCLTSRRHGILCYMETFMARKLFWQQSQDITCWRFKWSDQSAHKNIGPPCAGRLGSLGKAEPMKDILHLRFLLSIGIVGIGI